MGVSESKEVKSVELCSGSDVLEGERREQSRVFGGLAFLGRTIPMSFTLGNGRWVWSKLGVL